MNTLKTDAALAELPAPIALTTAQLAEVAAGTGAMLGAYLNIHIAGGMPAGPIYSMAAFSAPPAAL